MFKQLGLQFENRKLKTRQLWEREFNVVEEGLDVEQVITFVDNLIAQHKTSQEASTASLRLLIKRAVADAEQITASIKMKAQTEAEDEAARIVAQAKQAVDEIRGGDEVAAQKGTEDFLSTSNKEAERKTKEATETQKQAEKETKLAAGESALEEPVQLEEEATVSEPAEVIPEEHLPEERIDEEESDSTPLKLDSQALYAGEVELIIAVPVEPVAVSKLYNHLQTIPEMKILYTRGSWDRGTTITVTIDKPIPLISTISKVPDVKVVPESAPKDDLVKGISNSILGAKRKGLQKIKLTLKGK
ncbi:hypothetical protein ACFLXU_02705 [Chloroflexota bacterium]